MPKRPSNEVSASFLRDADPPPVLVVYRGVIAISRETVLPSARGSCSVACRCASPNAASPTRCDVAPRTR